MEILTYFQYLDLDTDNGVDAVVVVVVDGVVVAGVAVLVRAVGVVVPLVRLTFLDLF
jgi:hypothetical protein